MRLVNRLEWTSEAVLDFSLLKFPPYPPISFSSDLSIALCEARSKAMSTSLVLLFFCIIISTVITQPRSLAVPRELRNFSNSLIHFHTPSQTPSYSSQISPSPPPKPPLVGRLVPALFVIGDSSVDCGTNNYLGTFARADRPPYGRDFDTHKPTGRFSNGRIPVDYLGKFIFFILD